MAGNGTAGYNGDGVSATTAEINGAYGIAVNGHGNLFIADTNNYRIREVNATTKIISTVAGNGTSGYTNDGSYATAGAGHNSPAGVGVSVAGNVYVADTGDNRVWEFNVTTHQFSVVAGTGTAGYGADGHPAVDAKLNAPTAVVLDKSGDLFIADSGNSVIREVPTKTAGGMTAGDIYTVAGTGTAGTSTTGVVATTTDLNQAFGVAVDGRGHLFIADTYNYLIQEVTKATGIISTYAGNGTNGNGGDPGGAATSRPPWGPRASLRPPPGTCMWPIPARA